MHERDVLGSPPTWTAPLSWLLLPSLLLASSDSRQLWSWEGRNSRSSPLQCQRGFHRLYRVLPPLSHLQARGLQPTPPFPCMSNFIVLIRSPLSRPFPGLWGFEGSSLQPPRPQRSPRTSPSGGTGAPSRLRGTATYLIPESVPGRLGASAASSSPIAACLAVVFLPPCQSETRILLQKARGESCE